MNVKSKSRNKSTARGAISVVFTSHGWEDYQFWEQGDADVFRVINELIEECRRTPHRGTGKPEPLKGDLSGFWSRRITREHRLVYFFEGDVLTILQCRYHYDK